MRFLAGVAVLAVAGLSAARWVLDLFDTGDVEVIVFSVLLLAAASAVAALGTLGSVRARVAAAVAGAGAVVAAAGVVVDEGGLIWKAGTAAFVLGAAALVLTLTADKRYVAALAGFAVLISTLDSAVALFGAIAALVLGLQLGAGRGARVARQAVGR